MRLTTLRLHNWLCHRNREVQFGALTVIRGPNGSGKSAIRDALDFVLTGQVQRVPLKGMRPMLLTEAADSTEQGSVSLVADGLLYRRDVKTGRTTACSIEPAGALALPYVLSPASFAEAAPDRRRALLIEMLGVVRDAGPLKAALIDAGHPASMVADLPPDAPELWEGIADRWRSEARGAWQEITGERWSAKAADWHAPRPADVPTDDEYFQVTAATNSARRDLKALRSTLAALQADAVRIELAHERLHALKPLADQHDDFRAARASAEISMAVEGSEMARAALDAISKTWCVCPACNEPIRIRANTTDSIARHHEATRRHDVAVAAEAAARMHLLAETQLHDATSAATRERVELVAVLESLSAGQAQRSTLDAEIARLDAVLVDLEAETRAMADRVRDNRAADRRDAIANTRRLEVIAAANLAAAIRDGEFTATHGLDAGLATFNAHLEAHARHTGWRAPVVSTDCAITVAGRPYVLLSEAERWRADAILAVAIAQVSDVRLVALDRWDVLTPADWLQPLHWLADLTANGDLDSAILAGTVPPPRCPPPGDIAWLELG